MANEKRLIDLRALGIGERNPNAFIDPERAYGWNDLLEILETALTADAVEVVRCKDCKHYKTRNQSAYWDNKALLCCRSANVKVRPEDFCSYGERKEGDWNG